MEAAQTVREQREIFGHPAGLYVLFFSEMWERVSYYGMRALLILYMTDYLFVRMKAGVVPVYGFGGLESAITSVFGPQSIQQIASQIYGLYTGLVYFATLPGGMIADRLLGQRKSVVLGGLIMATGQFLLMSEPLFLAGLLCLIVGNGCFKPNISTQVGGLYPQGDPRRDRAYTIFYMGINVGAFIAPLICGTLGQWYGWKWGFMSAGVGMLFGVCFYLWGQRFLAKDQLTMSRESAKEHRPFTRNEWAAILGLVVLCVLNTLFWAVYEQQGNTLPLLAT